MLGGESGFLDFFYVILSLLLLIETVSFLICGFWRKWELVRISLTVFFLGGGGVGLGVAYETKILALLLDLVYNFNFVLTVSHVARKITCNWIITTILMYGAVCFLFLLNKSILAVSTSNFLILYFGERSRKFSVSWKIVLYECVCMWTFWIVVKGLFYNFSWTLSRCCHGNLTPLGL